MNRSLPCGLLLLLALNARAAVEVTFARNGGDAIDSGSTLEITVRSTDATPREVRPMHLEVPADLLLGDRSKGNAGPVITLPTNVTDTKDLDAGGNVAQSVYLPPLSLKDTLAMRALFFKSDEFPIYSIVEYSESLAGPLTQIRQKHTIRVTGPLAGIVAGGFIGVVLAVLFTWAFAKSQGKSSPGWKQQAFIIVTGILTVTIVALIRYADETLLKTVGIVLGIYDFRGGMLLGFAFQPVAKKLSAFIAGEKPPVPEPKPVQP
jgi:hypothetical protein